MSNSVPSFDNVFSAFDAMSSGQIVLNRAGIEYGRDKTY